MFVLVTLCDKICVAANTFILLSIVVVINLETYYNVADVTLLIDCQFKSSSNTHV